MIQYADVVSKRTNLSPLAKDYRGAISWMHFDVICDDFRRALLNFISHHYTDPKLLSCGNGLMYVAYTF